MELDPVVRAAKGMQPLKNISEVQREKQWRALYEQHVKEHEGRLKRVAAENAEALRSPAASKMIGVEGELPEYTRRILGEAMAKDKIGPQMPKVSAYESDGNRPTAAHSYR